MKHHIHHHGKNKTPLGIAVTFVSIASPLMTIPQVVTIFQHQDATNISFASWSFYLFGSLIWLTYGVKNKIKPIILNATLWVIFESAVVLGIVLYG